MDSDSLLWVDGNTNGTPVIIPSGVTCTYNVDKPAFWPPMSVLSGLASGFCERRAVLYPTFSGVAWNDQNKDDIVNRCANGFALGSSGAALFNANNIANFRYPQVTASNYMTAVDAAITTLITGDTTYVKPNGSAYGNAAAAFDGLASAADARADISAGSSIIRPTSDGYAYQDSFMLAYPSGWAKERKWMLDELRYTGAVQTLLHENMDAVGSHFAYQVYPENAPYSTSVELCRQFEYDSSVIVADAPYTYCGMTTSNVGDQEYLGRTYYATMDAQYNTVTSEATIVGWKPGRYISGSLVAHNCYEGPKTAAEMLNAIVPANVKGATVTCNARFEQGAVPKRSGFSYQGAVVSVTGAATVADAAVTGNTHCYEVKNGGVLTVPSGQQPYSIIVSAGGVVAFENGSPASSCIVLDGGTVTGIPNVQNLAISGFYPNGPFEASTEWPYGVQDPATLAISATSTYTAAAGSTYNTTKNGSAVYVSNGTLTLGSGCYLSNCRVLVLGGGQLVISGLDTTDSTHRCRVSDCCIKVLSGGTLTLNDNFQIDTTNIFIYGGGVVSGFYNWDSDRASDMDETDNLYLAPGATVNLEVYGWGSNYDELYKYIPCTTHMHFRQNSISAPSEIPNTRPVLNVIRKYEAGGSIMPTNSEAVFYNTVLYLFNGNGIVLSGNTESITEGENAVSMAIANNATTISVAGYTESEATITATNRPLDIVQGGERSTKYLGFYGTSVIYRCALQTLTFDRLEASTIVNHYEDFRVRQWSTDPAAT